MGETKSKGWSMCPCFGGEKSSDARKGDALFWSVVGLGLLAFGIGWLGNELAWWSIALPFWPVAAVAAGIAILISAVRNAFAGQRPGTGEPKERDDGERWQR